MKLEPYQKEELVLLAKRLKLKNISPLPKDELIKRINLHDDKEIKRLLKGNSKGAVFGYIAGFASIIGLIITTWPHLGISIKFQENSNTFLTSNVFSEPTYKLSSSFDDYLSHYKGTGDIEYDNYNLTSFQGLELLLSTINKERMEFPKRAISISLIQNYLDSGDLKMADFSARQLKEKQRNLARISK